jgi:RNA polymerase sigma-70 factor, ECF subfamily
MASPMPSARTEDDRSVVDEFVELRPLLFSIAYRMLGSVSDAEDVVQDAYLRYHGAVADGTVIESPKAYLSAVTTRLSIDLLRSARVRRETYVGEWLPEPLLTDPGAPDPGEQTAESDSLSMAFLLVLERLSPVERAVFLLHDVFGYEFPEIARIVEKSEANCRQVAVRARKHVAAHRPRFETSRQQREQLADRFLAALVEGDVDGLVELLAADVVVTGDSAGVSPSWPRAIVGRAKVARLMAAMGLGMRKLPGLTVQRAEVNGQPGALLRDGSGALISVFSLEIADGAVQTVRSVISRDKLRHLGRLAELPELLAVVRQARSAEEPPRPRV